MWINRFIFMLCCGILLKESLSDIKKRIVHIRGAVIIGVAGIAGMLLRQDFYILSFLAAISIGGFLYAVSILSDEKIGRGDAIYMIALGMVMDFSYVIVMVMLACFFTSMMGIVLMILKKADRKSTLPFFPFLTGSFVIVNAGRILGI